MIIISRSMAKTVKPEQRFHTFSFLQSLKILVLAYIIFLPACTSHETKKIILPGKDSLTIILPKPTPITAFEQNSLNLACQYWFDNFLARSGFNGAVLVSKGGNVVFKKLKGTGHIGSDDSLTNATPFHIASVSKTITAMSILKLWQDGKINLDDEYSKYFSTFNYPGVTIRTLLDHRSGLPNYLYFMHDLGWNESVYIKNQDVFDCLVAHKTELKNTGPPDKRFEYCNTNYALLALLAEKISGLSFPEFIKKEFFAPLNMTHSFIFTLADSAHVNPSYGPRGQMIPLNYLDLVYGDKNVYTTAEDLLIWDRALRSDMIFKPATLEQAYMPYSNEKPGIRNYGLGWRMNIYPDGKKMIYHNGWWHGYNAAFIRLIPEDATIIVMGNRYTNAVYKAKYLANIFGDRYLPVEEEEEAIKAGESFIPKKRKRRR